MDLIDKLQAHMIERDKLERKRQKIVRAQCYMTLLCFVFAAISFAAAVYSWTR